MGISHCASVNLEINGITCDRTFQSIVDEDMSWVFADVDAALAAGSLAELCGCTCGADSAEPQEPCMCATSWTSPGECEETQNGCPAFACEDPAQPRWCIVANDGCIGDLGGYMECDDDTPVFGGGELTIAEVFGEYFCVGEYSRCVGLGKEDCEAEGVSLFSDGVCDWVLNVAAHKAEETSVLQQAIQKLNAPLMNGLALVGLLSASIFAYLCVKNRTMWKFQPLDQWDDDEL